MLKGEKTKMELKPQKIGKKALKTSKKDASSEKELEEVSDRRKFIKKVLGGAAALGAASLVPSASALDIRDSHGFQVYDDTSTEYLDVNAGGPVEVKNTDLKVTTGHFDGKYITKTNKVSSNYTTSGEQIIFADSSSSTLTVTLASADVLDGSEVVITDVGGSASTNNITIDTESSETIDGSSTKKITSDYGAQRISSDGSNWYTSGGGTSSGGSSTGGISEKLYTRDPRR